MEELNELELALLEGLRNKYPDLQAQISSLKVKERRLTAAGMDVIMQEMKSDNTNEEMNALFSNGENIQVKSLKEGLSYVIDITAGQITAIEFSTYNEKWDGKFVDYKILEREI